MFGRGEATESCRRCSTCSIHYPDLQRFEVCDVCETATSRFTNVGPDEDWEDRVKYARSRPVERAQRDPHAHRFDQYLRMGFGLEDAQKLANAVWGPHGMPLWHETVRRALAAGCDRTTALEIFV